MAGPETNTRKIVRRLERDGWVNEGGGKHDVFKHPDGRKIAVPRHANSRRGLRDPSLRPQAGPRLEAL